MTKHSIKVTITIGRCVNPPRAPRSLVFGDGDCFDRDLVIPDSATIRTIRRAMRAIGQEWSALSMRVACAGGTDEHVQIRLVPDDEMPGWVWTRDGGLVEHPDGRHDL